MSNVVHLHKTPPRIAHYLGVGHREHVLADRMRSEGRLLHLGLVFDAPEAKLPSGLVSQASIHRRHP